MKPLAFAASCVAIVGCFSKPPAPGVTSDDAAIGDGGVDGGDGGTHAGTYQLAVTGSHHVCALDDGSLYCWGDNARYQLGDGTTTPQTVPQHIGTKLWTALASRYNHTCGIDADQHLSCWGVNNVGQANNKATPPYVTQPTQVEGGSESTFVDVSTAQVTSCAVSTSGALWCFGEPPAGYAAPGFTWTKVSVGSLHVCGIASETGSSDAHVYCFGPNDHGQSGQLTPGPVTVPTLVPAPSGPRTVPLRIASGDDASCAIFGLAASDDAGELWCWGSNSGLPDGARTNQGQSVRIGDGMWRDVQLTNRYMCAVDDAGKGRCWGISSAGELGDGVWANSTLDANNTDWGQVDRIVPPALGGAALTCMQRGTEILCAGDSEDGQLGYRTSQSTPIEVVNPNGQTWANIVGGRGHMCATDAAGALSCWGDDTFGEVAGGTGHGSVGYACQPGATCAYATPTPAPVAHAQDVVAGNHYTCARDDVGSVSCWGDSSEAQIGTTAPPAGTKFVVGAFADLVGGPFATCGLTTDQAHWTCWGDFPDSEPNPRFFPASEGAELAAADYTDPTFGRNFVCARTADGKRTCYGANSAGQLGQRTLTSYEGPSGWTSAESVSLVRAAELHACEIRSDTGAVYCWGLNTHNSVTQGVDAAYDTPLAVSFGTATTPACTALALASDWSCAVCDGRPWCWGGARTDVLGRGPSPDTNEPHVVSVPDGAFAQIAVTDNTGCALSSGGTLYCWGHGARGELGDGSHAVALPIALPGAP